MNDRERYLATMRFQPVDRPPLLAGNPWAETLARWRHEGLPLVMSVADYFGYDRLERAPVDFRFVPPFPKTVLAEDEFTVTYLNDEGIVLRDRRDNWERAGYGFGVASAPAVAAGYRQASVPAKGPGRYLDAWWRRRGGLSSRLRRLIRTR